MRSGNLLFFTLSIFALFPFSTLAGNVVVRNGQLNVSGGVYSDSETFYVDSENDRVGIGTTTPGHELHVVGSNSGDVAVLTQNLNSSGYSVLRLYDVNGDASRIHHFNSNWTSGFGGWEANSLAIGNLKGNINLVGDNASSAIQFFTGGHNKRMVINSSGYVGIGALNPVYLLEVNGSILGGGKGSYTQSYLVPNGTNVDIEWRENTTSLSKGYSYRFTLVTQWTGTDTGAVYVVWYNESGGNWTSRLVSRRGTSSNHPLLAVDTVNDRAQAYHNHASPYTIRVTVEYTYTYEPDSSVHVFGAESMWQRDGDSIYYNDGYVGIGVTGPTDVLDVKARDAIDRISIQKSAETDNVGFKIKNSSDLELWSMAVPGDVDYLQFFRLGTGNVLVLRDNGNVGIGETSPRTLLDVGGITQTSPARIVFHPGTSTNSAGMYSGFYHHDTIIGSYQDGTYAHGFVSVGYTGTQRTFSIGTASSNNYTTATFLPLLTVKNTGSVGIGATDPEAKTEIYNSVSTGRTLAINQLGDISANSGGATLFADNAYTNIANNSYKYSITHASLGAAGVAISEANNGGAGWNSVGIFANSGATTADAVFDPNWIAVFESNGNVGIGTTNPGQALDVVGNESGDYVASFHNEGNNVDRYGVMILAGTDDNSGTNYHMSFQDGDGTGVGFITSSGGTVTYGQFTANHDASIPEEFNGQGYPYGTVVCIIATANDPERPKQVEYQVAACNGSYDKTVLGVYSGKYADKVNLHSIFALGDGHILVTSEGGNIEVGDYLTSSEREGYSMKQDDDILHSYTVAKATQAVDWDIEGSESKLISCTYHSA